MTTYSYSRLGTFDGCPRKYYYQYVAKIKLEDRPPTLLPSGPLGRQAFQ